MRTFGNWIAAILWRLGEAWAWLGAFVHDARTIWGRR
jgi:hypothetical protein